MDSGRKALLDKAREFGSLAQNWSQKDFLEKTVTYRTLARYLDIQSEWWGEFWRSFSLSRQSEEKLQGFRFRCKIDDAIFLMHFLELWFGKNTPIAEISVMEFRHVYRLVMSHQEQ